jgi:proteic killer suppression protein
MRVEYRTRKLERHCTSLTAAMREWGAQMGRLVMVRPDDIRAAHDLAELQKLPQADCHPLKEDRRGQFAVSIKQPYRLIFEPADSPPPLRPDGSVDCAGVTAVRIIEVVDYHG